MVFHDLALPGFCATRTRDLQSIAAGRRTHGAGCFCPGVPDIFWGALHFHFASQRGDLNNARHLAENGGAVEGM